MTLGQTLKLGYLENTGSSNAVLAPASSRLELPGEKAEALTWLLGKSPSRPSSGKKTLRMSRTLKLSELSCPDASGAIGDETGSISNRSTEPPTPPLNAPLALPPSLEWTHPPVRRAHQDGNTQVRVSKSVTDFRSRDKKMHLIQTTRLEPSGKRSTSRPPSAKEGVTVEQIVVKEADLRRCGRSLTLLRQCQVPKEPLHKDEGAEGAALPEAKGDLELSFKSRFAKLCMSPQEIVDPWKDMANPEESRQNYEGDLILNQVWLDTPPKKEPSDIDDISDDAFEMICASQPLPRRRRHSTAATRASSADPIAQATIDPRLRPRSRHASRHGDRHRTLSESRAELSTPPSGKRVESRRRRSGLPPRPDGNASSKDPLQKRACVVEDRIRLVEDDPEDDVEVIGSHAVRVAARQQRHFLRKLDAEAHTQGKRAVWVLLDPLTGDLSVYDKAVATRLETAFVNNRTSVPLAGLKDAGGPADLEDAVVFLGSKGSSQPMVHRCLHGGQMDVRRIEVSGDDSVIRLPVRWDRVWHISDVAIPGTTEERTVALSGYESVRPASPPLPPVNPDRRQYFFNAGADSLYS